MIRGYFNNEEESKLAFKTEDAVRWIHAGDRGHIDEDGVICFEDRLKRMLVRHDGFKVYPSKIESVIASLPQVDACCVVDVADAGHVQGQLPFAFIVPNREKDDNAHKLEEALAEACRSGLPEHSQPCGFAFITEIPLTPVGKVDYLALKEMTALDEA